jgi:uncharacterized membrane protein YtjA (UPF0391 family)
LRVLCPSFVIARVKAFPIGTRIAHLVLAWMGFEFDVLMISRTVARPRKGGNMLYYALVFLIVALIAGFLGFGGVAVAAAGIAKILFFIFLIMFLVTLITHLSRGRIGGV